SKFGPVVILGRKLEFAFFEIFYDIKKTTRLKCYAAWFNHLTGAGSGYRSIQIGSVQGQCVARSFQKSIGENRQCAALTDNTLEFEQLFGKGLTGNANFHVRCLQPFLPSVFRGQSTTGRAMFQV